MSCNEWREDVSGWLDRELPAKRAAEVAAHLECCRDCRRLASGFRQLATQARRVSVPRPGSDVTRAAMALVRARELRQGWSWWSGPKMFWPKFSLAASGLAIAGLLAFIVLGGGLGAGPRSGASNQVAQVPQPTETRVSDAAAAAPAGSPSAGAPAVAGSLIVSNPTAGAEQVAGLARALGGNTDTVAASDASTVYVSIPESARGVFQARLPEIGDWRSSQSAPIAGSSTTIGIRIIKQP